MSEELKYVLLPSIEGRRRPPKFQPWYRERFRTKYPCSMDTKSWKFVKDGLDDFRDGLPPPHDDIILESEKGPGPSLFAQNRRFKATASNISSRLKEHQIYFSRELPSVEKRRQLVDSYISTILDHPMAFFPHFNQTLPSEMYERVAKLLEAELLRSQIDEHGSLDDERKEHLSSSPSAPITRPQTGNSDKSVHELPMHPIQEYETSPTLSMIEQNEHGRVSSELPIDPSISEVSSRPGRNVIVYDESGNQWNAEELERKQKNPYRWFVEKQREKQKAKGPSQDDEAASAMESRLRDVSEQFCNWLHDLGGESNVDVDPAVVRNLFSTAYDTKPSLSVPIKIVEMTRIPAELREGVQETMVAEPERSTAIPSPQGLPRSTGKLKEMSFADSDRIPRPPKYKYGAWYLPKNLWQRAEVNEELRDPKVIKAELEDATRKREEQINARLAPLHGVKAFKDYLLERNVRRLPKLITDVEQYRRDHPREATTTTLSMDQQAKGAAVPTS